MRFSNDMLVLGTNSFNSTKNPGKVYYEVNLLDANKACDILCDNSELFSAISQIPTLTKCRVDFNLTVGRYTTIKVVGLHTVQAPEVAGTSVQNKK